MPTYTITDPQTGKKVRLTGDSPPTEAELTDIFAKLGGGAATPPAPNSKADVIARAQAGPRMPAAGRGTQLDVRKSDDFAQGIGASIPFAGIETPDSGQGIAGRVVGEAAQFALPMAKGAQLLKGALPSTAKAGAKFQQVMGAAKDIPIDVSAPGDAALRIYQLSERGGTMPKVVRDFLKRATDPAKPAIAYQEARDFASNISRLSADEFGRLTPVMANEVHKLRIALNKSVEMAARQAGKGDDYLAAMKEYAQAAKAYKAFTKTKDAFVNKLIPGGIAIYGLDKIADAVRGK